MIDGHRSRRSCRRKTTSTRLNSCQERPAGAGFELFLGVHELSVCQVFLYCHLKVAAITGFTAGEMDGMGKPPKSVFK
jgi:hypothetical protein